MKKFGFIVLSLIVLAPGFLLHANSPQPPFTPETGFGGHSQGDGWLRLFFGRQRFFHVESRGYVVNDSAFRLDQTVTFQGKPPKNRHWILKNTGSNRYTGTVSDAPGAVEGHTDGSRLFLRYRIKGPLVMHQTLELMPDGKTIDNVGKITLLGIPVGFLRETIARRNPSARLTR